MKKINIIITGPELEARACQSEFDEPEIIMGAFESKYQDLEFQIDETIFYADDFGDDIKQMEDPANPFKRPEDIDLNDWAEDNDCRFIKLWELKSSGQIEIEIPEDQEFDPKKAILLTYDWILPNNTDFSLLSSFIYDGKQYEIEINDSSNGALIEEWGIYDHLDDEEDEKY